ncbi:DUF2398 family protein [Geodermatophilus sp. URMC 62]|uniref:DUF2398 family protein n=1 Tax=Geodermatophilus sp. URMC 62 TaxID=3423414 RepID=UPI00406C7DDC
MTGGDLPVPRRARRAWAPEADAETAAALRLLAVRPWLVAGRDDEAIAAVRRNLPAIRDVLDRLGWVLVAERGLVRLRKFPPVRRDAWATTGPAPLTCSWFFLLVAAAESMPPRVGLAQLVTAARAAAAEAELPVRGDITERRAIVAALRMLDERGVVVRMDGDVDGFVADENAPVLLAVHHTRLAHVIANTGSLDPAADPVAWLEQVETERDAARRMRRRLVDDSLVHVIDLDDVEADWLSRRVRGDDGGPLAAAFGLHLERRAEGAAFVLPTEAFRHPRELGPLPFPVSGTVPHAALLLCDAAATGERIYGGPGPGWRGLAAEEVPARLADLSTTYGSGRGGWAAELAADPARLAAEVAVLLTGLGLLRVDNATWWFSPATGRWPAPPPPAPSAAPTRPRASAAPATEGLPFGPEDAGLPFETEDDQT